MKKVETIGCVFSAFISFFTVILLITQYSDSTHVLGGWLITRNIIIILIPIVIFVASLFVLIFLLSPLQDNNCLIKLYRWFLSQTNTFFFIFLLVLEITLVLSTQGIFFSKGILLKAAPDIILTFSFFCINLMVKKIIGRGKLQYKFSKNFIPFFFLGLLFLTLFINYRLVGIEKVLSAKSPMGAGAPITEIQASLAVVTGLLFYFLLQVLKLRKPYKIAFDISIVFLLFIFAFITWNPTDIPLNYLMRNINGDTLTPYADSRIYDLNGIGYAFGEGIGFGTPPAKPLYSFFLGVLHLIFKFDYPSIINTQMIFLCLIPCMIYLVANQLFHRSVGIMAAILVVFREYNLIYLSSITTQSNLKMLLSESFSILFILIFILAALIWFNHPNSKKAGLIAGTFLGLCILIRAQLVPFIAVFILLLLILKKYKFFNLRVAFQCFLLGIALILLPWMNRNAIRSGQFSLEDSGYVDYTITSQTTEMTQKYSTNGPLSTLVNEFLVNPKLTLEKYSSFFNDSLMSSLYQLPTQYGKLYTLQETIKAEKYSYPYPYQEISNSTQVFWILNSLIILMGVLMCWQKSKWRGLIPFLFYLLYSISLSILKFSGWRFIQPVDWVFLLYWSAGIIGFIEVISIAEPISLSVVNDPIVEDSESKRSTIITIIVIVFIGLLMPISELLIPRSKMNESKTQILEEIINTKNYNLLLKDSDDSILDQSSTIIKGTILYPVYLDKDERTENLQPGFGHYPSYFVTHTTLDNNILQKQISDGKTILYFTLVNDVAREIYLFSPSSRVELQGGESVIVIGCDYGDFFEAKWMVTKNLLIKNNRVSSDSCSME